MIFFLFGDDNFTLTKRLREIKTKGEVTEIEVGDDNKEFFARLKVAFENQGLFSARKIIIIKNSLAAIAKLPVVAEYLEKILEKPTDDEIYFVETEGVDRRLKFFKKFQKAAKVQEFSVPEGKALENWIAEHCREKGFAAKPALVKKIIALLGDEFSLWQADQEISKLALYSQGKDITPVQAEQVISRNITSDAFEIINLAAEQKNVGGALSSLEQMLAGSQSTEMKAEIIKMVGALASQIRSLLLVKDLEKFPQAQIAEKLQWKPGRVWIMQKLSKNFTVPRLRQLLSDLKGLDLRLKTSEEPPKLLLALFLQKVAAR